MKAPKKAASSRTATSEKSVAASPEAFAAYTALDFSDIEKRAHDLADRIEAHFEELAHILLEYESYEVVVDEISRTLDVLRNLKENEEYFRLRIGEVTTFLPRNQPLYAFTCFVVVPSFMASKVYFRIPQSMRHFFPKLLALLEVYESMPNIVVSHSNRSEFLRERTALRVHPGTKETLPVTDVVIFTGTPVHADQLRFIFDQRTLFITNGSGHNPIVVSKEADIANAVEAVLTLQLYNQGQDCAAPNTVLVEGEIYREFLSRLRDEIRTVKVGDYRDRQCRVGPISDPKDLVRIQDFLIDNREWLDPTTPGIIRSHDAILEPTIIAKPLKDGGNFSEIFAPVMFLQRYEKDEDLAAYFEDPRYALNAMYLTIYGASPYLESLIDRPIAGKVLHDRASMLHNTHLHEPGNERGTQPYGGYGYGASNLSIDGKIMPKPTLPQRDIYEWVAKPLLQGKGAESRKALLEAYTDTKLKDVQKLLKLKSQDETPKDQGEASMGIAYADLEGIETAGRRYAHLNDEHVYRLLERPNVGYIARLGLADLEMVRAARALLIRQSSESSDDFTTELYAVAADADASKKEIRDRQLQFFQHAYQLLLGRDTGPRLAQFLLEIDREKACELLDV